MSITQTSNEPATPNSTAATVDQKLEVIVLPVADVDRAKRFYQGLGWRMDGDFTDGKDWRVVQMTPPGSPCSILFGKGFTAAVPGSMQGNFLVVDNVEAARADLIARDADVSEVFHFEGVLQIIDAKGRAPGRDPQGRWVFFVGVFQRSRRQQLAAAGIQARLPGRGLSSFDVATLTALLRETEERHGAYQATAPKHHWSDW